MSKLFTESGLEQPTKTAKNQQQTYASKTALARQLVQKYRQQQQPAPQQDSGFHPLSMVNEMAKGIVKVPLKSALSLAELPQIIATRQDPNYKLNLPWLGNTESYQHDITKAREQVISGEKTLPQLAGEIAKPIIDLGSFAVGGGVASKALTGKQALIQSLKQGAGMGAVYGANDTMSEGGNIGDILGGSAKGTIAGALTAGALHGAGTGISKLTRSKSAEVLPIKNIPKDQKIIQKTNLFDNAPSTKQRGFISTVKGSNITSPEIKKGIKGSYNVVTDKDALSHAQKLIKESLQKADDEALKGTDKYSSATAMELVKHYQNVGRHDDAIRIINEVAPKLTEAGQYIQAASLYNKLTPEGLLRFAQKEVTTANKKNPKLNISLTAENSKTIKDLAEKAQKATGEDKLYKTQEMIDYVHSLVPSENMEKLTTVWKAGLLSNPTTHMANITSTGAMTVAENAKDIPAVFFDKLMSLKTGVRTKSLPSVGAGFQGAKEGASKFGKFMQTGIDPENVLSKIDYKKVKFDNPLLQKYTDTIFRALGGTDKIFKESLFKKSLHELATVDGLNKGINGKALSEHVRNLVNNPTDDMVKVATQDALYGTFNSENVLADFIGRGKQALGNAKPLADILMPFVRTPTNVAARIADYSPLGFGKAAYQGATGKGQRAIAESLGRATVGTGILGAGYGLAEQGMMTGTYPTNSTERNMWELQGKQANSINIGGKWLDLSKISPIGNVLGAGANLQKLAKEKSGADLASAMIGQSAKGLTEQTFLKGMSAALDAINDPARSAENFARQQLASTVPSIVGALARTIDPTKRETNSITDAFKARVPGLSQTLQPKLDVLGKEQQYNSGILGQFINPFRSQNAENNPIANEIDRIMASGANVTFGKPNKSQSLNGIRINLTPEELTAYEKASGGMITKALNALITTPEYQMLSDDQKANKIENVISKVRALVKPSVFPKDKIYAGLQEKNNLKPYYK